MKLINGGLRSGRFLVSTPKSALYPRPARQLERICSNLGAPKEGYRILEPHLSAVTNVHFGYEPENNGELFKCYLEFSPDKSTEDGLVFLALKWAVERNRAQDRFAVTNYWSRNTLSPELKEKLVATILPWETVRMAACSLLEIASKAPGVAALLEVEEPGNPRRSIDINLADAKKTLNDLSPLLKPIFGGKETKRLFDDLLANDGAAILGHFAAGTARDGSPFSTLYYGVQPA